MTRKNKNILLLSICFILILSLITTIYYSKFNNIPINIINTSNHQIAKSNNEKEKTPLIKNNNENQEQVDNSKNEKKNKVPHNNEKKKELSKIDSKNLNQNKVIYMILIGIESFLLGSVITLIIINNKMNDNKT